jgi:5-methylcytosine-specific restriction protein A
MTKDGKVKRKELKQEFLHFLSDYMGEPKKFFQSFEGGIKRYLSKYEQRKLASIFELNDIKELEALITRMDPKNQYVYYNKPESTKEIGLKYYIEFLKRTSFPFPEDDDIYREGGILDSHGTKYERNPKVRRKCINHYGCKCTVCGFDFESVYGDIGKDFIEVHHLKPLSETGEEHKVNPIEDLRPVCSNCHSMLHRSNPPLSIEGLQSAMRSHQ